MTDFQNTPEGRISRQVHDLFVSLDALSKDVQHPDMRHLIVAERDDLSLASGQLARLVGQISAE